MSPRRTAATAGRVLMQLRHDPRTLAMVLVVPVVLMTLLRYMFGSDGGVVFNRLAPGLLAIFPFLLMFIITSVAMLRERSTGTLERLLTMPTAKLDLLLGYALAFGLLALVQVVAVLAMVLGPLGLHVEGSPALIAVIAVADALLGTALGLCASALARTEFQAVQLMPAIVLPQLLLCGLFAPREGMASALRWASDALPLTYAVDGARGAAVSDAWNATLATDFVVIIGCIPVALAIGALTLRRRSG